MRLCRRFIVSGRVQGVGFRMFTREAARRAGLSGTVQNLDDGRVEAVAEGDTAAILQFEGELRRGSEGSRVDDVQVHDEPAGTREGFRILP